MVGTLCIAACTRDGATIQVRTDRASYQAGDRVVVTITNATPDTVLLVFCGSRSEHTTDGQRWIANVARSCGGDVIGGAAPGLSRQGRPGGILSS